MQQTKHSSYNAWYKSQCHLRYNAVVAMALQMSRHGHKFCEPSTGKRSQAQLYCFIECVSCRNRIVQTEFKM